MKAILKLTVILTIFLTHITIALAQTKEDVIYLADGSQKKERLFLLAMTSSSFRILEKKYNMN